MSTIVKKGSSLKKLLFMTSFIIILAFTLIYYLTALGNQVINYPNIKFAVILGLGGYMLLFVGFIIDLFVQQLTKFKDVSKK